MFGLSACYKPQNISPTPEKHLEQTAGKPYSKNDLMKPPSFKDILEGKNVPVTPEESKAALKQYGRQWFYGHGIGKTMINVGTVVIFPPYALYLLGNAGLSLAWYEQVQLSNALPNGPREYIVGAFDELASVPGRINAAVAGENFENP